MEPTTDKCPHCERREQEEKEKEEMNLAVLIALTPLLAMTLFGQIGII
ncbi:MAG: hypothetical protein NT136_02190 [Candidatus Moranbacteria bacterium]|nr:hypothetical protein [Candidatus Moranbacteria bacterium]